MPGPRADDGGRRAIEVAMGVGAAFFGAGLGAWVASPYALPVILLGGALLATAMSELQLLEPRASSDLDRLQRLALTSLLALAGFLVSSAALSALVGGPRSRPTAAARRPPTVSQGAQAALRKGSGAAQVAQLGSTRTGPGE